MNRSAVHYALGLVLAAGLVIAAAPAQAQVSERVAVIRIKAVEGLEATGTPVQTSREQMFLVGSTYRISKAAVASLDGVTALVLIDRRTDAMSGGELVQRHKEEVLVVKGDTFTLKGVDGRDVTYSIDRLSDGSVDLLGPSDRIIARAKGEYKVWKVEGASLVLKDRIALY